MFLRLHYIACVVSFFLGLGQSFALPRSALDLQQRDTTPSSNKIQAELGPKLCKGALIYFPSNPEFGNYTERWSSTSEGDFLVVVVAGCDDDVATAVKFANLVGLPFLAVNTAHGTAKGLSSIKHGFLIKLVQLDSIAVAKDGKTAKLGGGVYNDQLLAELAKSNKVAATGACGCIGLMGPGLGGGLGKYMGYAGLISDNIVSMNVVVADGSQITVSASSHPELYWGMRGAGHNFGIVTSLVYKVFDYPRGPSTYYSDSFYSEDKLEAFFKLYNKLLDNGKLEKNANVYVAFVLIPDLGPKPIILLEFTYFGTASEAAKYLDPFFKLEPLLATNNTVPYKDLARAIGASEGGPVCLEGGTKKQYPVGLKVFNIETTRKIYKLFADLLTEAPDFKSTIVQFEGYSVLGKQAIDPASSAYAHREDSILVSLTEFYPSSAANDAVGARYGEQAKKLWVQGEAPRRLTSYTNYVGSDETPEQMYGYEPWRLERLRALKKKWDPKGKFNFYNPVR